jgi:uncharacterized protein YdiU (UPF0061 family)
VQSNSLTLSNQTSELTIEDSKILSLKYSGKQFGQMQPAEVLMNGKALLLKIHVITGWTIPEKELLNILVDQFTKILCEKYDNLNVGEIEFAFRSKGTGIEDWGKAMNLNLLDKVLTPYLNDRYKISETERQIAYKKSNPHFSLDNLNHRAMIEEDYQFFLSGKTLLTFPVHYYKILEEDGFIKHGAFVHFNGETDEQKRDDCVLTVFNVAKQSGVENLYKKK